jgi:UDP:flavonoid glycosyltransferase YjiC (YdhE family)
MGIRKARIVLTTFGSLGDLHPYLAIAAGLRERGHDPVIATSGQYRDMVEALGLGFHAVRPDMPDLSADTDLIRRIMDLRRGPETVIREFMMPALRQSYEDTLAAAEAVDLLVSHPLTFTTQLAAQKRGIPWASSVLAPLSFFSAHDPPVLPALQFLSWLRPLGPALHRPLLGLLKRTVRSWVKPWHHLRAELGLPAVRENPLFEGQHSPSLVLALFSGQLGSSQPDWPARTSVTGFPFFHRASEELPEDLACFLDEGEPPVVFTLGSSAVHDAGGFYEHSVAAARALRRRAVLLVGADPRNRPASLPAGMGAFEYAPFSALFPRAAAIVHQGGVGTTAEAMRSGRPMLVMPYAHDQPDNAARVARLGIARVVPRRRYNATRAEAELRRLLDEPAWSKRAGEVSRRMQAENGAGAACEALEQLLQARRPNTSRS